MDKTAKTPVEFTPLAENSSIAESLLAHAAQLPATAWLEANSERRQKYHTARFVVENGALPGTEENIGRVEIVVKYWNRKAKATPNTSQKVEKFLKNKTAEQVAEEVAQLNAWLAAQAK